MKTRMKKLLQVVGFGVIGVGAIGGAVYGGYRVFGAGPCLNQARADYVKGLHQIREGIRDKEFQRMKGVVSGKSLAPRPVPDSENDVTTYDLACAMLPQAITTPSGLDGLRHAPPYCDQVPKPNPAPTPLPNELASKAADAVGALIVKDSNDKGVIEEFWGTGFVIANNVLATSCHTVHPLLVPGEQGALKLSQNLVVRFHEGYSGETPVDFNLQFLTCSQQRGLDVALLLITGSKERVSQPPSAVAAPTPVPIYMDDPQGLNGQQGAIIGYADLRHFVDEHAEEMYDPYKINVDRPGPPDLKFALPDTIASVENCEKKYAIVNSYAVLLDVANTTIGQSGAPFFLIPMGPQGFVVGGLHTCCSAYFESEEAYGYDELPNYESLYAGMPSDATATMPPSMACAQVRRTFQNQAVSTTSIVNDPDLCPALRDNGGVRGKDGSPVAALPCGPVTAQRNQAFSGVRGKDGYVSERHGVLPFAAARDIRPHY